MFDPEPGPMPQAEPVDEVTTIPAKSLAAIWELLAELQEAPSAGYLTVGVIADRLEAILNG